MTNGEKCFPPVCPSLSVETHNTPLRRVANIFEHFPLWCWTTGLKCAPHSPLLLCESNWSSWNGADGFAGVWMCSHSVRKSNPIRALCFSSFYEISHFLAIAVCFWKLEESIWGLRGWRGSPQLLTIASSLCEFEAIVQTRDYRESRAWCREFLISNTRHSVFFNSVGWT